MAFGSIAPLFYGSLVDKDNPDPSSLFVGFLVGAVVMIIGGLVAFMLAVDAENKSLEEVAPPLSLVKSGNQLCGEVHPASSDEHR